MHRKSVVILFIMILTSAAVMGCSHTDGENNKHVMIETMSMTEKETPSETEQYIEVTLPEVTVKDEPETVTQAETVDCSQLLDGAKEVPVDTSSLWNEQELNNKDKRYPGFKAVALRTSTDKKLLKGIDNGDIRIIEDGNILLIFNGEKSIQIDTEGRNFFGDIGPTKSVLYEDVTGDGHDELILITQEAEIGVYSNGVYVIDLENFEQLSVASDNEIKKEAFSQIYPRIRMYIDNAGILYYVVGDAHDNKIKGSYDTSNGLTRPSAELSNISTMEVKNGIICYRGSVVFKDVNNELPEGVVPDEMCDVCVTLKYNSGTKTFEVDEVTVE